MRYMSNLENPFTLNIGATLWFKKILSVVALKQKTKLMAISHS